jgi:hypothetical protein
MAMRRLLQVNLVCAIAVVAVVRAETAEDRVYRNRQIGFELTAPEGWRLTTQTGFPSLLLVLLPDQDATDTVSLSLTVRALDGRDLAKYVSGSKRALQKAGLRVLHARAGKMLEQSVWLLGAETRDGRRQIRQVFFKLGQQALTWTLSCPQKQLKQLKPEIQRAMFALQPLSAD